MSVLGKAAKILNAVTGSEATRAGINVFIGDYGKMIELKLDTRKKKARALVLLNGETVPIEIKVDRYEILREGDVAKVVIHEANSDKPWLNAILQNLVCKKSFEVPPGKLDFITELLG